MPHIFNHSEQTSKQFKLAATELILELLDRLGAWDKKFFEIAPKNATNRKKNDRNLSQFIRAILGLLCKQRTKQNNETIYYLEGLRNVHYFDSVPPTSITIIGSRNEKKFAKLHGHRFIWSFPIEGAVRVAKAYNIKIFITLQFLRWSRHINQVKNLFIITYEDTQPLGAFLAQIVKHKQISSRPKCICVQHGYFPLIHNDIPCDGSFTEYNFLWDVNQANIIGCEKTKSYEIGPPVICQAKSSIAIEIFFVGTGTIDDGSNDYQETLEIYKKIFKFLPLEIQKNVFYRPHPNEFSHVAQIKKIKQNFSEIDVASKKSRLCGNKSIFIGTVSSLLFEASYCGHLTVMIDACRTSKPSFKSDALFDRNSAHAISEWILVALSKENFKIQQRRAPKFTFHEALDNVARAPD